MKQKEGIKIVTTNKKAHFNYFLSDFTECGIALFGTEIKSIRESSCSINDSYIIFRNEEAQILNMHINPYENGNIFNRDPLRNRTLLLHKKEIRWFMDKVKRGGYTVVPTRVYLKNGRAKVEIALAKGKKTIDKRETIKERDIARENRKNDKYGY